MTSNLLRTTLELLEMTSPEDWKRLAPIVDATPNWLRALAEGRIKEPGINKIERLYNELSGKQVQL